MLKADGQNYRCLSKDLSTGGMLLAGMPGINLGATLELITFIPGRTSMMRCAARIARVAPSAGESLIAVIFDGLSQQDREHLDSYLSQNLGQDKSTPRSVTTDDAPCRSEMHRQNRAWRATPAYSRPRSNDREMPAGPTGQDMSSSSYPSQYLNDLSLRGNYRGSVQSPKD